RGEANRRTCPATSSCNSEGRPRTSIAPGMSATPGGRSETCNARSGTTAIPWMAATLDGIVEGTEAVFEAKFMLPWSFWEEAAAIQGELLLARRQDLSRGCSPASMQPITTPINGHDKGPCSNGRHDLQGSDQKPLSKSMRAPLERCLKSRAIAQCFLRLS